MLNYEEELKKFKPCLDVDEVEDAIYSRDLTDVIDILKEMMKNDKPEQENGVLSFDYKLKPGPVTERNAIRILEICGYPQEVVQEAYSAVGQTSQL